MIFVIDTNIAIRFCDGDPRISLRTAQLPVRPVISVLTRVELESGVYRDINEAALLRPRLDLMLENLETLPFTSAEAEIYGRIVEQVGFSRSKVIDRMIAAQAIAVGATLLTLNARDFRDIPGLLLEDWSE